MFFSILPQAKVLTVACTSPGRRGVTPQSFIRGGSATRYNPLPFYIPFLIKKKYPFRSIPSIDKWYPLHIPSLELCTPFNCCKCTFFMTWINLKPERFLEFSSPQHASVIPSRPFRAVFTWLSKGIGFGFGFTTPFGWLVYLLWFWFYDSQVKTALTDQNDIFLYPSIYFN